MVASKSAFLQTKPLWPVLNIILLKWQYENQE